VEGQEVRERKASVLENVVDDVVVVEVDDGIKDGVDDSEGIMLSEFALCEDAVNARPVRRSISVQTLASSLQG